MKVANHFYQGGMLTSFRNNDPVTDEKVQLVLMFGPKELLAANDLYPVIRDRYPLAEIVQASTAGQIYHDQVIEGAVVVTAVELEQTIIRTASVDISHYNGDSGAAGAALVECLSKLEDLCYMLVLSDGAQVNGSQLVNGIETVVRHRVPITGGLAGDGVLFSSTMVGLNGSPEEGRIVAVAFYGHHLLVSHSSLGGWERFGPESRVTRSSGNRLWEINHGPALDLYKKYLGPYADDLPGSAFLFPLSVQSEVTEPAVVRTILSINPEDGSMVFAGDIPNGARVRFMKANFDKLIDAASEAALATRKSVLNPDPKLALLISCVGRKIILDSRTVEEVEAVREAFGPRTFLTGFYSYGELSPFVAGGRCELHNQSMTITTLDEI